MKPVTATPATVTATPNLPITVTSQRTTFCVMCSALSKPCPLFSPPAPVVSPPHSNWPDTEMEEDWGEERQKEEEFREKEQKEKRTRAKGKNSLEEEYYLPSLQCRPYSPVCEKNTLAPTLTLVPATEKKPEEEGDQNWKCTHRTNQIWTQRQIMIWKLCGHFKG